MAAPATAPGRADDPRLAEPWRRLVGWLIEAIIVGIVGGALWIPGAITIANRITSYDNLSNTSAPGPVRPCHG